LAYIEWNDRLSVRVRVIDGQHRELLRIINELHDAMTQGQGAAVLGEIIDGLIHYTNSHFRTEEAYFESSAYPGYAAHKREHQDFVARVTDFKQGFDEGRILLTIDVMDFLGDWLLQHIQGSDAAYAPFVAEGNA
jgi:hemerythrin